jgi:hypothetical protein
MSSLFAFVLRQNIQLIQDALRGVQHEIFLLEIEEGLLECQLSQNNNCSERSHRIEDHYRQIVMNRQRLVSQEQSLLAQISELEH